MRKDIEQSLYLGDFQKALSLLLKEYPDCEPEESIFFDSGIQMVQYWNNHLKDLKKSEDPMKIWDQFIHQIFFKNRLSLHSGLLKAITFFIMGLVYNTLETKQIRPEDKHPFDEKLSLARCLLLMEKTEAAFIFITNLIKQYPHRSEPWALAGKIYFLRQKYEKSLLFYRESFFINPSVLNLYDIKSDLTDRLTEYYKKNYLKGYDLPVSELLMQWLGICGVTGRYFQLRRELSFQELNELDKRIQVYENKFNFYKQELDRLNLVRLTTFKADYYMSQNQEDQLTPLLKKLEIYEPLVCQKIKQMRG